MIEQVIEDFRRQTVVFLPHTQHAGLLVQHWLIVAPVCSYFEDSSTRLSQSSIKDCTRSPSSMGRI